MASAFAHALRAVYERGEWWRRRVASARERARGAQRDSARALIGAHVYDSLDDMAAAARLTRQQLVGLARDDCDFGRFVAEHRRCPTQDAEAT